jgi:hypothetical protein
MRFVGWLLRALAVGSAVAVLTDAQAQVRAFERLVMPGPLASAHAEYEAECGSCHVRFERQSQRQLCLDCHKEIADDFATKTGFHSRSRDVGDKECASCHTDHEGRDKDILGLDERAFDHGLTDFELLGKHAQIACADCHEPPATFHAAETECIACHREDDQHHGNLGESCADCHSSTDWRDVHFDHEVTTGYALTGAHAVLETCVTCHVDERYEGTPDTCVGCHREDDKHMGLNGPKCEGCHATTDWKETRFDHFKATGFALSGGHSGLMCESCHEGNKYEVKVPKECYGCHAEDDKHEGRNGEKCADCHKATEWTDVTFDHARDTDFPLNGAHGELECVACHVQPVAIAVPDKDCFGCHMDDDPHGGQLGQSCGSCHAEVLWDQDVRFDHDLSRFPLLGKHREVVCEDCHETPKFHDAAEDCLECHAEDDVHESRFGGDCALCHNPNDWQAWTFDHTAQTDFALDGAHSDLDCNTCHRKAVATVSAIDLATACGGCHRKDDVHDGEFGQQCERCHTTESFRQLRVLQ